MSRRASRPGDPGILADLADACRQYLAVHAAWATPAGPDYPMPKDPHATLRVARRHLVHMAKREERLGPTRANPLHPAPKKRPR